MPPASLFCVAAALYKRRHTVGTRQGETELESWRRKQEVFVEHASGSIKSTRNELGLNLHSSMAKQAAQRVPNKGSWAKGVSGNPSGRRPRPTLAFAERVRERIDPDLVIDLAMRVAEDETKSPSERLAALWPLIDRGFVKPPTTIDANVTATQGANYDLSGLDLDAKRELLGRIQSLKRIADGEQVPIADGDPT